VGPFVPGGRAKNLIEKDKENPLFTTPSYPKNRKATKTDEVGKKKVTTESLRDQEPIPKPRLLLPKKEGGGKVKEESQDRNPSSRISGKDREGGKGIRLSQGVRNKKVRKGNSKKRGS